MNLPDIKKCRKCDELFDIATDYDLCPRCRNRRVELKEGDGDGKKY